MNKDIIRTGVEDVEFPEDKLTEEEKRTNFIRNSIDLIVLDTGYPVLANTLQTAEIAERKELRALERKGLIKVIDVEVESTLVPGSKTSYRAYYTERHVPEYVTEQEQAKEAAPVASEGKVVQIGKYK